MARRPAPTPESLLKDIDDAERALGWMDRLKWVVALLPVVVAAGMRIYWQLNAPEAPDLGDIHVPGLNWMVVVAVLAGAMCFVGFTFMGRHFRRVLAETREQVYAKRPDLRPAAPPSAATPADEDKP